MNNDDDKQYVADRFASKLRALMVERAVTAFKMSTDLGIHTSQIYNWRTGRAVPVLYRLIELADYFDVPLDDLTGRYHREVTECLHELS